MDASTQRNDAALYFLLLHFLEGLENIPRVAIRDRAENHESFLVCKRWDCVEVGKSQVQTWLQGGASFEVTEEVQFSNLKEKS